MTDINMAPRCGGGGIADNSADTTPVTCDGLPRPGMKGAPRPGMKGAQRQARYRSRLRRLGVGAVTVLIPELSAKARRQAAKLNHTLDELAKLDVEAQVGSLPGFLAGPMPVCRVRLVLRDPPHNQRTAG